MFKHTKIQTILQNILYFLCSLTDIFYTLLITMWFQELKLHMIKHSDYQQLRNFVSIIKISFIKKNTNDNIIEMYDE